MPAICSSSLRVPVPVRPFWQQDRLHQAKARWWSWRASAGDSSCEAVTTDIAADRLHFKQPRHHLMRLLALHPPVIALAQESKLRLVRESEAQSPEQERSGFHVPPGLSVQLRQRADDQTADPTWPSMHAVACGSHQPSSIRMPPRRIAGPIHRARGSKTAATRSRSWKTLMATARRQKVTDFAGPGLHSHRCAPLAQAGAQGRLHRVEHPETSGISPIPMATGNAIKEKCSSARSATKGRRHVQQLPPGPRWLGCMRHHGFNNTSHLKAKDGSTLDLHSGNVFRFRPDGSHVEITRGVRSIPSACAGIATATSIAPTATAIRSRRPFAGLTTRALASHTMGSASVP